jgi:hypothetical protein
MNDDTDIVLNEGEELASIDELATVGQPESTPEAKAPEPELPEKYRGKSASEIARMHMEAEKAMGRQGAELGELRRLTDDVIKRSFVQPSPAPSSTKPEEEEFDIFTDPNAAVNRLVENHPKIRQLEQQRELERREAALERLEASHPDYEDLATSDEFQKWVGSSKVRSMLFAKAHSDYDFDAADELFSTFKQIKGASAPVAAKPPAAPQSTGQTLPRGRTVSGDTGFESSKKVWSRAEIIRLHQTDRRRYEELQPEIMKAYSEKRVR